MIKYKVTVELGNFDEEIGYHGGNVRIIDSLKSETEAVSLAKLLRHESLGIPITGGYTVIVNAVDSNNGYRKEILREHAHPSNMTGEERRYAKKIRLKALGYKTVRVIGKPKEGEIYYFKDGEMVHEQHTSVLISQSASGIMQSERPAQNGDKKILRGMLARVGDEYYAKYYDKTPWETQ